MSGASTFAIKLKHLIDKMRFVVSNSKRVADALHIGYVGKGKVFQLSKLYHALAYKMLLGLIIL